MDNSLTNRKVCPKCLKNKSLEEYKRSKGKVHGYCKPCELTYYREYNGKRYATEAQITAESKRAHKRYQEHGRPARKARKYKMIQILGGACSVCGYCKNAAALDFDHIKPVDKKRNMSYLLAVNKPWGWEAAMEEVSTCRLLCANCHRTKTHPDWDLEILKTQINQLADAQLESQTGVGMGDSAS